MVQVVGITVNILVIESLCILFEIVVTDAERFRSENLRRVCKRTDGIAYGLESLFVACNFTSFGGFKQGFFVFGFHVRFVLQTDIVGNNAHLFVSLQRSLPPVSEFAIDILAVGIVA